MHRQPDNDNDLPRLRPPSYYYLESADRRASGAQQASKMLRWPGSSSSAAAGSSTSNASNETSPNDTRRINSSDMLRSDDAHGDTGAQSRFGSYSASASSSPSSSTAPRTPGGTMTDLGSYKDAPRRVGSDGGLGRTSSSSSSSMVDSANVGEGEGGAATGGGDGGGGGGRIGLIKSMVQDNPYFSAGAGLMGIGVVLTTARRLGTLGATFAQRRMLVTLEIPSKDRSYPWFLEWMAQHSPEAAGVPVEAHVAGKGKGKAASPPPQQQQPSTGSKGWFGIGGGAVRSHQLAVETSYKQHENGSSEALFSLVPGPGTHYFRYKGAWMQVKRERDSKLMDLHSGVPWETVTLTALSRDRQLFPELLAEARALADKGNEGKTVVYTAWGAEWRPFGKPRRKRDLRSVVLGTGVAERVESDLRSFLGRGKWYADRGIPYRRGYLLHGPPGSGKTSFIQALAGALSYNICLLNLSERGLTDDKLNHLLGLAPERSFILLEDVDAAFNRRVQTSEDGYKSSVTFSGLLNALDGVASAEERVIFMTTNHFDRLDPALVRPGRVDLKELLDDAAPEQAERLFLRFYGAGEEARAEKLREIVATLATTLGRRVSMAALQGHFIRHDVEHALDGIDELFVAREAPPSEARGKGNFEVPVQS